MNNSNNLKGFTLTEMLISISLGLFLSTLLIKIYLWQTDLQHQMEDMIFIDHNGFLALQILKNSDSKNYYVKNNELRSNIIKEAVISGVTKLNIIHHPSSTTIQIELLAPHKMTAKLEERIDETKK